MEKKNVEQLIADYQSQDYVSDELNEETANWWDMFCCCPCCDSCDCWCGG